MAGDPVDRNLIKGFDLFVPTVFRLIQRSTSYQTDIQANIFFCCCILPYKGNIGHQEFNIGHVWANFTGSSGMECSGQKKDANPLMDNIMFYSPLCLWWKKNRTKTNSFKPLFWWDKHVWAHDHQKEVTLILKHWQCLTLLILIWELQC